MEILAAVICLSSVASCERLPDGLTGVRGSHGTISRDPDQGSEPVPIRPVLGARSRVTDRAGPGESPPGSGASGSGEPSGPAVICLSFVLSPFVLSPVLSSLGEPSGPAVICLSFVLAPAVICLSFVLAPAVICLSFVLFVLLGLQRPLQYTNLEKPRYCLE